MATEASVGGEKTLRAIILAAGKGKRMKSDLPKVLHLLCGTPLLAYSVGVARAVKSERIVVVVGHQSDRVREAFANEELVFVEQRQQLGTGHAILQARNEFTGYAGAVLILCGDVPLLRPGTVRSLVHQHWAEEATVTVLTTVHEQPEGYGRVVTTENGDVVRIVEERDATREEREIKEINTGIYCVDATFLFTALARITDENVQREYYLTDIIDIARKDSRPVRSLLAPDTQEVMGVNTADDLAKARVVLDQRVSYISCDDHDRDR